MPLAEMRKSESILKSRHQLHHHQKAQVTSTLCIYLEKCALIYKASLVAGTAAHCNVPQCNAQPAMHCGTLQTALLYC